MSYKLNDDKVRWIIRELEKGELSRDHIAWAQGISRSRISRLWREYLRTGQAPILKPSGRPRRPIEPWEIHVVAQAFEEYRVGACLLEGRIEEEYGVHMGHNRIHRIMLELGISREEMRKKGRRKWVRHERPHSMQLWHTDLKRLSSTGRWLIACLDDASRYVVSYQTYEDTSTKASLEALGIRHIVGRVNHPQTNGKIERLYGTVEQKLPLFDGDLEALFAWYNGMKPHMALSHDGRRYDTPLEAFWYKMTPRGSWATPMDAVGGGALMRTHVSRAPPGCPFTDYGIKQS